MRYWYCTMKRKKGVKIVDEINYSPPNSKKDWTIEVWEDKDGDRGILVREIKTDYCFIVPSAISKKDKEKLVLENTKLPKYIKELIESEVFREI